MAKLQDEMREGDFPLRPETKLIGRNLNFSAAIQDNTDYLLYNSLNRLVHPQFFLASQLMDLDMSCLIVGGGWKVNLLKEELEKRKSEDGMMMFTDSYDVIFAASSESILGKFIAVIGYIFKTLGTNMSLSSMTKITLKLFRTI